MATIDELHGQSVNQDTGWLQRKLIDVLRTGAEAISPQANGPGAAAVAGIRSLLPGRGTFDQEFERYNRAAAPSPIYSDDSKFGSIVKDPAKPWDQTQGGAERSQQMALQMALIGALKQIPKPHGTVPVKEGNTRLYHQTYPEKFGAITKEGLSIDAARGIEGPKRIYASETPFYGDPRDMHTIEFQVPKTDFDSPFTAGARRNKVPTEDFIAAHEPWHARARYWMDSEPEHVQRVLSDIDNPKYMESIGREAPLHAKAAEYIKALFAGEVEGLPKLDPTKKISDQLAALSSPEAAAAKVLREPVTVTAPPLPPKAETLGGVVFSYHNDARKAITAALNKMGVKQKNYQSKASMRGFDARDKDPTPRFQLDLTKEQWKQLNEILKDSHGVEIYND